MSFVTRLTIYVQAEMISLKWYVESLITMIINPSVQYAESISTCCRNIKASYVLLWNHSVTRIYSGLYYSGTLQKPAFEWFAVIVSFSGEGFVPLQFTFGPVVNEIESVFQLSLKYNPISFIQRNFVYPNITVRSLCKLTYATFMRLILLLPTDIGFLERNTKTKQKNIFSKLRNFF